MQNKYWKILFSLAVLRPLTQNQIPYFVTAWVIRPLGQLYDLRIVPRIFVNKKTAWNPRLTCCLRVNLTTSVSIVRSLCQPNNFAWALLFSHEPHKFCMNSTTSASTSRPLYQMYSIWVKATTSASSMHQLDDICISSTTFMSILQPLHPRYGLCSPTTNLRLNP